LRHSHASQLLRQGINAKVVSERLGHAWWDSRSTFTPISRELRGSVRRGSDCAKQFRN
jgi:site-specific recombinase XerD